MNKIKWLLLLVFVFGGAQAKDVHEFYCNDTNKAAYPTTPASKTHFAWKKNGNLIFDRIFTDGYSRSRNAYATFYCSKKIIRYQLTSCSKKEVNSLCQLKNALTKPVQNLSQQSLKNKEILEESTTATTSTHLAISDEKLKTNAVDKSVATIHIKPQKVETNKVLLNESDYQFVSHYVFSDAENLKSRVTKLYFKSDTNNDGIVSDEEKVAASQYEYILMGPEKELFKGVTTTDGTMFFDLSANPIYLDSEGVNVGIAAKPLSARGTEVESSIRWILDTDFGAQGAEIKQGNTTLDGQKIWVENSTLATFSQALSGLKISHFTPQKPLFTPTALIQPFYRLQVQNLSSSHLAYLKRGSLDMRLIGMQKINKQSLNLQDYEVVEIDSEGNFLNTLAVDLSLIEDSRNGANSLSFAFELDNFSVPVAGSRVLEFRIKNTADNVVGASNDDGIAVQLRSERFYDKGYFSLEALSNAYWVWSDFAGGAKWKGGAGIDLMTGALVMQES